MWRSVKDMTTFAKEMEVVRENMGRKRTREEAQEALRACGVFDENNEVVEALKDIFVKIEPKHKKK